MAIDWIPKRGEDLTRHETRMQFHWTFLKNAVSNLGRGGAAAVFALLLPPILVRHMAPAAYAVWVLVLQTAAYVSYLDFGLQTAIGRYVAYAGEKQDVELRDSVFSTALAGLCIAALVSLVFLAAAVFAAPLVFPSVPGPLVWQMRLALLIVGFAMAVALPASACNGVFIGIQRYEIPAMTVGSARLVSAIGLILAALAGRSLVVMALIVATANLLAYFAQYLALRRIVPDLGFRWASVRRSTARELTSYCFGLTIVAFSMLLITGLDLVMVGRFEFSAVTPYSIAAGIVAVLSGVLYAIVNVIMPHAAALHAREKNEEMGRLVVATTRISVLLLILTGVPILVYAGPIIRVWIGQGYVAAGMPLLAILVVANIIRLAGAPYATVLVAAGQQNYVKIAPLAEGVSNFIASVVLGFSLGAMGVALGTFIGAVVGVGSHLFYSIPRTHPAISFSRRSLVLSGVLLPLVWASPMLAVAAAFCSGVKVSVFGFVLATLVSAGMSGFFLFRKATDRMRPAGPAITRRTHSMSASAQD